MEAKESWASIPLPNLFAWAGILKSSGDPVLGF
jgi:hypothetical protein